MYYIGVHFYATWRIRLNRPCAVAMWPYVKLTLPFVTTIRPHRSTTKTRPVVTYGVAWSVGLSVCHVREPCITAEMSFGFWTWVGPRNHVLDGGRDPHAKGQFEEKRGDPL